MPDNQYFYTAPENIQTGLSLLYLTDEEARHCLRVLRKKAGDRFYVVDGTGNEYWVELEDIKRETAQCTIIGHKFMPRELKTEITLAQALIKKDHFEWALEKTTELGVRSVIPMKTGRSLIDPGKQKIQRWNKTLLSAMKQSERALFTELQPVTDFEQVISMVPKFDLALIAHENSDRLMMDTIRNKTADADINHILVLVGPEGGFTDSELHRSRQHNITDISLGPRRLRSETAAVAVMAILSNAVS